MRTKTLLIAAAALVAGVISSEAQAVYSVNVAGYVNVTAPAGEFVLVNNPLTQGPGADVVSNVLQNLPGGTTIQVWNGVGFDTYTYSALQHHWKNGATIVDANPLPPGVGFFLFNASSSVTNTFSGNVVASTGGGTATNVLTTSLSPVGALVPYVDVVTNTSTFNLQVQGGSSIQKWSVPDQQFYTYTYNGLQKTWKLGAVSTNLSMGVAEGFFIQPASATNWVETLQ